MDSERIRQILVVEDDQTMLSLLDTLLEMEGFDVTQVKDYESALESMRQAPPDLVILDVYLNDRSGLDLMEVIRKDGSLKATRVIMSSGMDFRSQCLEKGADDFVMKPYMPEELVEKIHKLIH